MNKTFSRTFPRTYARTMSRTGNGPSLSYENPLPWYMEDGETVWYMEDGETPWFMEGSGELVFITEPSLDSSSYTNGDTVTLNLGTSNGSLSIEYFRSGGEDKTSELSGLSWTSSTTQTETITYRVRLSSSSDPSEYILSDEVTAQLAYPVTTGMTLDATWDTVGEWRNTLVSATSASSDVYCTFDNQDVGILQEQGATGRGFALYIFGGVLYFQCGDGGAFGSSPDRAEISWSIPNSSPEDYKVSWSANTSRACLYIDDVLVGSDDYSEAQICGTDDGGIGQSNDVGVAVNRGGWTGDASGVFTGSIDRAEVFKGEVTADV